MFDVPLNGALGFIFLAAIPITFLLNLAVQALYRRSIQRVMRQTTKADLTDFPIPRETISDDRVLRIQTDQTLPKPPPRWTLALRYLLAGIAYAVVEMLVLFTLEGVEFSLRRSLIVAAVFMTPAVPFCVHVAGLRRMAVWFAAVLWIVVLALIEIDTLVLTAIQVGPPAIAAMVLANRVFRTTSLTLYLISLALIITMLFALDLALLLVPVFIGASLPVAILILTGVGITLAWGTARLLAWISASASDLMLQGYAIWIIMTLWQIALLSSSQRIMAAWAILAFIAYVLTLYLTSLVHKSGEASQTLFLRVFGQRGLQQKSTHSLMTNWRVTGPVFLIGAGDLATETLDQNELSAFLSGATDRLFIKTPKDIDRAIARSTVPAQDGLYPILDFYCQDNTWRPSVQILMNKSARVVLDLRGFSKENEGVKFEIAELVRRINIEQLKVLVDQTTDTELAQTLFLNQWSDAHGKRSEIPVDLKFVNAVV